VEKEIKHTGIIRKLTDEFYYVALNVLPPAKAVRQRDFATSAAIKTN